tara:strand:- start:339 stop:746 length:408 start_codon:yes stop_codon:yes gene_type:complete
MASTLKINTLTGVSTAGSIAVTGEGNSTTTNLQQGLCKAWCHYATASSFTNKDNFNITSLTDNGAGDCTLTITNAFSNSDYADTCSSNGVGTAIDNGTKSTTLCRIQSFGNDSSGSSLPLTDANRTSMHCMGDLA